MAKRASNHIVKSTMDNAPENDVIDETRQDIERTRASMGETLDSIGDRLSPERFKAESVDAAGKIKDEAIDTAAHLKDAAVEAAKAATQEVIQGVKHATWEVYDNARSRVLDTQDEIKGAGMTAIQTLKNNPIPTAMVGLGLYWLYQSLQENQVRVERSRRLGPYDTARPIHHDSIADTASNAMGRAKDKMSHAADTISHKASEVGESLTDLKDTLSSKANDQVDEFQTVLHSSPLVVGGVAAAVGLAFGMMLPTTEVENRTMGTTRDQLVDLAQEKVTDTVSDIKEKAHDLTEKAVEVATSSVGPMVKTVREESRRHGLSADLA